MSLVCSLHLPLFWSKLGPAACVPMQVAPTSSSTRATMQSSSPSLGRKLPLHRLALEEGSLNLFPYIAARTSSSHCWEEAKRTAAGSRSLCSSRHPMKKKLNVQLFAKVTSIKVLDFEFPVVCMETIMHLTCMNMPVEKIDHALNTIKANGIQKVLALKGDPPHGQDKFVQVASGFACALDLHIRAKYGDYFGITVAGYPKAHPDMIQGDEGATLEAYNSDLAYLKRKVKSWSTIREA
ncbi:hypothetical protein ZIOFF_068036 [Zingiber officinale]|uniref:Methylenetetrahydrofolate reductase n=1 Tax=Zingiber officinale TaxID=94328 RepID=A0A8J5C7N9_ZINOF|nr:hypothetical protein ZIOFF_068036 [Zingiber officinale]